MVKLQKITIIYGMKRKELRKKHKMTQTELARILNIDQRTLSSIETGKTKSFSENLLICAANYFQVSIDYLLENNTNTYELGNLTVTQREILDALDGLGEIDLIYLKDFIDSIKRRKIENYKLVI